MAGSGTAHLRDRDALLRVEHLVVEFPAGPRRRVHAVSDISIDVMAGETLGLVGESGCGKSTAGRAILQLPRPTAGKVFFDGQELTSLKPQELRSVRRSLQLIFQDPISSLNPRRRVADIVAEPLTIWNEAIGEERRAKLREVFDAVGLDLDVVGVRRPHEFSGGQCQRVSIARALVLHPKLLICDEPVSALDVSVQAQILNLLEDAKDRYGLTMIFIAHDLAVVKNISDRVAVMYLGKLCEVATADDLYAAPAHPYTTALLASIPSPDPEAAGSNNTPGGAGSGDATGDVGLGNTAGDAAARSREALSGELPSPIDPPSGCRFRTRCPRAAERCTEEEPIMRELRTGHFVACHFPHE